ncbi:MAG: HAD hydrolase-like protein [Luteibacter sp.]|uniref:HAD hydrolase-like protein n=1 Tax=Luteibacter sp. TaxID=1886636 RepID=UPI00280877F9|nr:HAD hydrolase-like protein [Luteibacter sp.]MDQ7996410.1 HAD hydrolase-like protein [Luteibacter sp.]MDQ8047962.1 HAD hydrolase-like protein [Luteibacter sp.]
MLILFDLDGTLINSEIGIFAGVRHSLATVGADVPDDTVLRSWIGPPLRVSFGELLNGDSERVEQAVAAYSQRFHDVGWSEHTVYPGIADLISALAGAGHKLAVVTSKVRPHAEPIIAHLPFGDAFDALYAPDPSTSKSEKAEMIAAAIADFGHIVDDVIMIGDRHFDIDGAVANGVRGIGVLWGFGDRAELEKAGAWKVVETPAEIATLVGATVPG